MIKIDMEKPVSCWHCPFSRWEDAYDTGCVGHCVVIEHDGSDGSVIDDYAESKELYPDCPLMEVEE